MSTQSEYDAASKAALEAQKKQENQRAKEKAKEEERKKLAALKSEVSRLDAALKSLKTLIDTEEFNLNQAKKAYNDYFKLAAPNGLQSELSSSELAVLNNLQGPISNSQRILSGLKTRRSSITAQRNLRQNQIKEIQTKALFFPTAGTGVNKTTKTPSGSSTTPPGSGGGGSNNNKGGGIDPKGPYKYNPPMVKSAYLGKSIAAHVMGQQVITAPGYTDAKNAWGEGKQSRGAIQMDKKFVTKVLKKKDPSGTTFVKNDPQLYGSF